MDKHSILFMLLVTATWMGGKGMRQMTLLYVDALVYTVHKEVWYLHPR